jgi:hypothetical protein
MELLYQEDQKMKSRFPIFIYHTLAILSILVLMSPLSHGQETKKFYHLKALAGGNDIGKVLHDQAVTQC